MKEIRTIMETLWNQGYEASEHPRNRGHDIDADLTKIASLSSPHPEEPWAITKLKIELESRKSECRTVTRERDRLRSQLAEAVRQRDLEHKRFSEAERNEERAATELAALRSQLAQATNNAHFWRGENSKTVEYYEAQLARKDDGLRGALQEIIDLGNDDRAYMIASKALAPEPCPAEEPAPAPSEEDIILVACEIMAPHDNDPSGFAIQLYFEQLLGLPDSYGLTEVVDALRSQLARKDDGLRGALQEIIDLGNDDRAYMIASKALAPEPCPAEEETK